MYIDTQLIHDMQVDMQVDVQVDVQVAKDTDK